MIGDRLCGFGPDLAPAVRAKRFGDPRPEQFQVVVDLRHRANGRARGLHRVRLLDRDSRRDSTNVIDAGLIHAVEELPHVRRKRFDVAALAFGVDRLECERGFAGTARPGDDGQFPERKIDIDAFKIVLTRPSDLNAVRRACLRAIFLSDLRTHWRLSVRVKRDATSVQRNSINRARPPCGSSPLDGVHHSKMLGLLANLLASRTRPMGSVKCSVAIEPKWGRSLRPKFGGLRILGERRGLGDGTVYGDRAHSCCSGEGTAATASPITESKSSACGCVDRSVGATVLPAAGRSNRSAGPGHHG